MGIWNILGYFSRPTNSRSSPNLGLNLILDGSKISWLGLNWVGIKKHQKNKLHPTSWHCLFLLSNSWLSQSIMHMYGPCAITLNYCTYTNQVRVSPKALYCVVDTSYGLGRSLGLCRPALLKGRKYQMVKTQTESHDWRDSPKLSSRGLAIALTNLMLRICSFMQKIFQLA